MVFAFIPITRPFSRCLTICRYCQSAWERFLVGGRPLPRYSGTFPHTSTIASSYPPHPSDINGGGECGCPRLLFSCSNASMAASVSLFAIPRAALSRVWLSIKVQRQNSPVSALSWQPPFALCFPRKSTTHLPEPCSIGSRLAIHPPLLLSAGQPPATTSRSCPP